MAKYRAVPDGNGYAALITSTHEGGRTIERIGEYKTQAQAREALEARCGEVDWTEENGMLSYEDTPAEIVPYVADLSTVGQQVPNGARALDFTDAILDHYARWGDPLERKLIAGWIAHTWFDGPGRGINGGNGILSFNATPRAMLIGEVGSGKSRKETLIRSLCRNPTGRVSGVVTSYGVRNALNKGQTLILDEAQRIFGTRGERREDLQGIVAGGYVFDGVSLNGRSGEGEQSIFGPICLAAQPQILHQTGDQLEDLFTRSFIIFCEKSNDEIPDLDNEFEHRTEVTRRELALWAASERTGEKLWNIHTIPKVLKSRDREITIPLLAVADRAVDPEITNDIRWAVIMREAAVRLLLGGGQEGALDSMTELLSNVS